MLLNLSISTHLKRIGFLLIVCFAAVLNSVSAQTISGSQIAEAAHALTEDNVVYDPSYFDIDYPNGDVPKGKGVCTDVVIRTFRKFGIDLQKLVHEDMKANFSLYPKNWGLSKPDSNIDHRRVPNLRKFFKRHWTEIRPTRTVSDYLPGDIVTWDLGGGVTHIGLVSEQTSRNGTPLIVHNIGAGQVLENFLFNAEITGHYRYP